ncbi:putative phosphoribosyltransferase [Crenobacter luteus]|uniref:phosphoribosyltransferase n=1 Tax=Crenobacter luteus TaxID=1452487 RepID=UPI00104F9343|nr:phosphoribosyltransferase family protein [Crenobacter luteus]TCP12475.1 putative phosphoribosyltransferase [Crenobacter luteus]
MQFNDREHAARMLAARLVPAYGTSCPLVLAIPRGAVPMARILADALGGDCDVVLVRKLGAPLQPELAIGAVDEAGRVFVNDFARQTGADDAYLAEQTKRELARIRERRRRYTGGRRPDVAGRTVIVVDDGLATGATMIAALSALRPQRPARLVCAVPVAPPDTLATVSRYADEVVCLEAPPAFQAVGQFYRDFPQVDDDEVVAILNPPSPGAR